MEMEQAGSIRVALAGLSTHRSVHREVPMLASVLAQARAPLYVHRPPSRTVCGLRARSRVKRNGRDAQPRWRSRILPVDMALGAPLQYCWLSLARPWLTL